MLDDPVSTILAIEELRVGDVLLCIEIGEIDALVIVNELSVNVTLELLIEDSILLKTLDVAVIDSTVILLPPFTATVE
jgi:hypothetical protein